MKKIKIEKLINELNFTSKNIINENRNQLIRLENSAIFKNPEIIYRQKENDLVNVTKSLNFNAKEIISQNRNRLFKLENSYILKNPNEIIKEKRNACLKNINKLEVLNPLLTLKRGYSIAKVNDKVITSSKDVEVGDEVDIKLKDGTINTKVI